MKRVLFDLYWAQPIGNSKFHGGGEYIKSVFYHFTKTYANTLKIIVFFDKDKFIDEYLVDLIESLHIEVIDVKSQRDIDQIINSVVFDVFYTGMPYHYVNTAFPKKISSVGTFHGLRPIEMYTDKYEFLYEKNILKAFAKLLLKKIRVKKLIHEFDTAIKKFNVIFCDSDHSKYAIKNIFNVGEDKQIVVYYAPYKRRELYSINSAEYAYKDFILILGANRWIKNSYRAIKAIDDLYARGKIPDIKTIIVGNLNWKIKKKIKNIDSFVFFNYVNNEQLEYLYANCKLFVYPTLNEGFGLPPLEAMDFGKTCLVSSVCSLPELCGDAVYYFNPYDILEIQDRILLGLDQPIKKDIVLDKRIMIRNRQEKDLDDLCKMLACL